MWRINARRPRPRLALRSPTNAFIHGLAVLFGAVWMVDGNELVRADARTGRILDELVPRARWAYQLAIARGSLWIGEDIHNVVYQVAPNPPRLVRRIPVPGASSA